MFEESDLLPLSGLQHLLFCERQWALIHIEQQWEENRLTQEGRVMHERVHESGTEARSDVVIARGLRVRSLRLGLAGELDVVEFHRALQDNANAICLEGRSGSWLPFPIEYKRGRPKANSCDEVQLCAQALCLEETFAVTVPTGALFYGTNRRRTLTDFDLSLRETTERLALRMHDLFIAGVTPRAVYATKCERCSLIRRCMPKLNNRVLDVERYLATALVDAGDEH